MLSILVKRVDDIPRSLLVTAASLDEAKKAKMLLGIHLKNVEFLDRTEKRMQRVQSDITAVQVGQVGRGGTKRVELNWWLWNGGPLDCFFLCVRFACPVF